MADQTPTLYERLGGTYGIAGAVWELTNRLFENKSGNANPYVNAFHQMEGREGFAFLVTAWSIEKTGGPAVYPGRDMKAAHEHLKVSELEFDVVKGEIASTLFHVGVPPQEHREFMDIIESYRTDVVGPADAARDIPAQAEAAEDRARREAMSVREREGVSA